MVVEITEMTVIKEVIVNNMEDQTILIMVVIEIQHIIHLFQHQINY